MRTEIPSDDYLGVGPYPDVYSHGPVAVLNNGDPSEGAILWICLDCGYVTGDVRFMLHNECDPARNSISQTWRQLIEDDGFPEEQPE